MFRCVFPLCRVFTVSITRGAPQKPTSNLYSSSLKALVAAPLSSLGKPPQGHFRMSSSSVDDKPEPATDTQPDETASDLTEAVSTPKEGGKSKGTADSSVEDKSEPAKDTQLDETASDLTEAVSTPKEGGKNTDSSVEDKPEPAETASDLTEAASTPKEGGKSTNSSVEDKPATDTQPDETASDLTEAVSTPKEGGKSKVTADNSPEGGAVPESKDGEGWGDEGWVDASPKTEPKQGFFRSLFSRSTSHDSKRGKEYYESLSLAEKRKQYKCGDKYLVLDKIEPWSKTRKAIYPKLVKKLKPSPYSPAPSLDDKVSMWRGDITRLEIDAIVNAANSSLLGGGGVDGAIHSAAGWSLRKECETLNGCPGGQTKISSGHRLPAKHILHTVGPMNGSQETLTSCYETCFQLVLDHNIRSVAFCCVATGIYGYPNEEAAEVALTITRKWLEEHSDKIDRIIFCVFLERDVKIYQKKLCKFFPPVPESKESGDGEASTSEDKGVSVDKETTAEGGQEAPDKPVLPRSATEPAPSRSSRKRAAEEDAENDKIDEAAKKEEETEEERREQQEGKEDKGEEREEAEAMETEEAAKEEQGQDSQEKMETEV